MIGEISNNNSKKILDHQTKDSLMNKTTNIALNSSEEDENIISKMNSALSEGKFEEAKELLKNKSISSFHQEGLFSPFHFAINAWVDDSGGAEKKLQIIKKFLKDPRFDPSVTDNELIIIACQKGYTKIVARLLKDERVDPTTQNNLALKNACSEGHLDVVKLLLQDPRVDPTVSEYVFCYKKEGEIKFLRGVPPDDPKSKYMNNYPIFIASALGKLEIVRELLKDSRVNPNNDSIYYAMLSNHDEVVFELYKDEKTHIDHGLKWEVNIFLLKKGYSIDQLKCRIIQ